MITRGLRISQSIALYSATPIRLYEVPRQQLAATGERISRGF
jgi:hypothetical protein